MFTADEKTAKELRELQFMKNKIRLSGLAKKYHKGEIGEDVITSGDKLLLAKYWGCVFYF